jgi:TRAP transporter TAXI family solute receptor
VVLKPLLVPLKEARMKRGLVLVFAAILGLAVGTGCAPEEKAKTEEKVAVRAPAATTFVTIGTGGVTGVDYPAGGAIARIVNQKRDQYGVRVTVRSTAGSVFNVNAIMAGEMDFGLVQSDRQYQAINALAEWKQKGKQQDLRAVFSIHPQFVTLVAAVDANIAKLEDLKGKRVNIGNPGSGGRQNAIDALTAVGIDINSDLVAESVSASEASDLLQQGQIDAFFDTVGHPSGVIKEAAAGARKVRLVPVSGGGIDKLIADSPYYAKATIPIGFYPRAQNNSDVETLGVKATLVTSAKVVDQVVYVFAKEVFDNFEQFKKLHLAFAALTKDSMLEGQSAQIHPGAMKYYKEAGLK